MVDSAADPVDGPTKIEQRQAADEDSNDNGDLYVPPDERKAHNIRNYHKAEIARLNKAIAQHQYVVDVQTAYLGDGEVEGEGEGGVEDGSIPSPLPPGTDIGDAFNRDPDAPDHPRNDPGPPTNPSDSNPEE